MLKKIISLFLITSLLSFNVSASDGIVIKIVDDVVTDKYIKITKNDNSYLFEECYKAHARCELLTGSNDSIILEEHMGALAKELMSTSHLQWVGITLASIATVILGIIVIILVVLGAGDDVSSDAAETAFEGWLPAFDPLNWPLRTKKKSKLLNWLIERSVVVNEQGDATINLSELEMKYKGFKERLIEALESKLRED